jgi:hypothetical protein
LLYALSFTTLLLEKLLEKLHGKKYFSKLYFYVGYYHGQIALEDQKKIAFRGLDIL